MKKRKSPRGEQNPERSEKKNQFQKEKHKNLKMIIMTLKILST